MFAIVGPGYLLGFTLPLYEYPQSAATDYLSVLDRYPQLIIQIG